jgi:hypothetical protein
MALMIFQAFGVPTPAIASMLSTIQRMRFFLHTGYGDSEGYARGGQDDVEYPIRTQGMRQGNTALPAALSVMSIPMIKAHRQKGHSAHFIAPISGLSRHLIGGLFVDDTNLFHLDMRQTETALEAHTCLQESVINWGKLLLATGGALKPAKCSYYLFSFRWKADGTWAYEINEANPDLSIKVPMLDGSLEEIDHLLCSNALKTLGSMTCPIGSNTAALNRMRQQGQEWMDKVLASKLNRRNVWFMSDCQLWPRIGYRICNNFPSWNELEGCLQRVYR